MSQKFYASATDTIAWKNGAVGHRNKLVGPFAKVRNCPIADSTRRLTCYATAVADTFFSVPACTRSGGQYISGFFTSGADGPIFNVAARDRKKFGVVEPRPVTTTAAAVAARRLAKALNVGIDDGGEEAGCITICEPRLGAGLPAKLLGAGKHAPRGFVVCRNWPEALRKLQAAR